MYWAVGGVVFAILAIAVVFIGWKAVKRQGDFEPMTAEEFAAEDEQP